MLLSFGRPSSHSSLWCSHPIPLATSPTTTTPPFSLLNLPPSIVIHRPYHANRISSSNPKKRSSIFDIFKEAEEVEKAEKEAPPTATTSSSTTPPSPTPTPTPTTSEKTKKLEATAHTSGIRSSVMKMKEVTRKVRGLSVAEALRQLHATKRKPAIPLRRTILMARNNASNLGIPTSSLVVAHIIIEKKATIKRIQFRGKGGVGRLNKRRCALRVVVKPQEWMKGRRWELKKMQQNMQAKWREYNAIRKIHGRPTLKTAEE